MSDVDVQHAWGRIRQEMRRAVGDSTWQLWLEPLVARHMEDDTLVIEAPAESRAWVEASFARLLAACAKAVLGASTRVKVVAPGTRAGGAARPRASSPAPS